MTKTSERDITIRPFEEVRDARRLREIVGEIWAGGSGALMEKQYGVVGGRPWAYWLSNSILEYFRADECRSFVVEKNGEVAAFYSYVIDKARSVGTVGYNGVAKGHQGTGIGSLMMDRVMDGFRSEEMEYATVLVADNEEHVPALRNYEKHGFHRLTGYHELVQKL